MRKTAYEMRISDWSSDGCSSDLYFRVIEEGVAQAGTEMRLVERRYPEWTITRPFHLVIGGGARSDMTAVRELSTLTVLAQRWRDRKSVASGKRVSVRVDLGGRRFIKKTNNITTQ